MEGVPDIGGEGVAPISIANGPEHSSVSVKDAKGGACGSVGGDGLTARVHVGYAIRGLATVCCLGVIPSH